MHRMLKNYCTSIFQIFGWIICVETVFEYRIHLVYSIKMKFLTYTSHNENFRLYTQIHCKVVVNSCQIKFARKDIILPSDAAVILCFSGIADVRPIYIYKICSMSRYYSIDNFYMKAKVSVSQQGQDWEAPQANDLKLAIPVYLWTFMSFNAYFLHLVYSAKDYT